MIRTKSEFLQLWGAGLLGNKLRSWPSIAALGAGGYDGPVSIRSRRTDSRNTMYDVPSGAVPEAVERLVRRGECPDNIYFNESAPDGRLLLQGEYQDSFPRNKYLMFSAEKTQMKRVVAWSHLEGSASRAVLRSCMNDNSWGDFEDLLERYPEHVVEFSAYECCLGTLPGRNVVIWEVRKGY